MPLLVFPANDIDTAGLAVDAELPVAWIEQELAEAEAHGASPGHITARLSRTGEEIVVRGKVSAKVTVPCARCLAPAAVDAEGELSLLLRPVAAAQTPAKAARRPAKPHGDAPATAPADAGTKPRRARKGAGKFGFEPEAEPKKKQKDEEYEFSAEEADVDMYDGELVVLDPFVREALLLELPNFPLCSESCPGIAPAAATLGSGDEDERRPPSVDPRLAPLSALRDRIAGAGASSSARAEAAKQAPETKREKPKKPIN